MKTLNSRTIRRALQFALLACLTLSSAAQAAQTDLADGPLVDAGSTIVKPNILYTLDDSNSMSWSYMPDSVGVGNNRWLNAVGYRNHLCNKIYYNPAITYLPKKNADGTDAPDVTFTAAPKDGFDSSAGVTDLQTEFTAFTTYEARFSTCGGNACPPENPTTAYYYEYTGTGAPSCETAMPTGSGTAAGWTKRTISSAEDKTNFANWYSYYRTRMLLMKTASGRAFSGLSDRYRVGFITINNTGFRAINDFNASNKQAWLTQLYSTTFNDGGTPLRRALSRAGRYFAGKSDGVNATTRPDPVQYSCQQNFTILTTDGYWTDSTDRRGVDLDGTTVTGNNDGTEPKPMWDGSASTSSTSTPTRTSYYLTRDNCTNASRRKIFYRVDTGTVTNGVINRDAGGNIIYSNGTAASYDGACRTRTDTDLPTTGTIGPTACSWTGTNCTYKEEGGVVTTTTTSNSSGTLADVAAYYYNTDLRTEALNNCTGALGAGTDVCTNNVFGPRAPDPRASNPEEDNKTTQHMSTFTLGLGVSGRLQFDANYKTQTTGDFVSLRAGTNNTAGLTSWPVPVANNDSDPNKTDDLWHAAVNGRGRAFAASNPFEVSQGLVTALSEINARTGAASAAAASNLDIVSGDNLIYVPRYTTAKWTGDLLALPIDLTTKSVDSSKVLFSVADELGTQVQAACDNRNIYLYRNGATNNLTTFTLNSFTCATGSTAATTSTGLNATEQAYFAADEIELLSQYAGMSDTQIAAAAGANLVNFLRGQRGKENFAQGNDNTLFRTRESVMGDVIGGSPLHIRPPFADYVDTGYADFKVAQASRTSMLYVPANDGMLHAIYAGQIQKNTDGTPQVSNGKPVLDANAGKEAWAFIPSSVLPNLYKLADINYANLHQFYVDGAPTSGDAYLGGNWKTILVGGLNKGGRGYYALDITDPTSPKALWEFKHNASNCVAVGQPTAAQYSDCHLGYTFGNPIIAKQPDGTWVVIVASGYNNVNATATAGDGFGYLYVLSAADGRILRKISTDVGSAADPSGLSKIAAWVDKPKENNTALRVYGGDLLGNVWRFDLSDGSVSKLAELKHGTKAQPVTTKPVLSLAGSPPEPIVFVGTGQYLGGSDLTNADTQSIYAIIDRNPSTPIAPRSTLAQRTISATPGTGSAGGTATVSCGTGGCSAPNGWYADFPTSKERVNIGPRVELGTLVVATGIPVNDACNPGGKSWVYYFDYDTGSFVQGVTGDLVGSEIPTAMVVGVTIVKINGTPTVLTTTNDGSTTGGTPNSFSTGAPSGTKVQWREVLSD